MTPTPSLTSRLRRFLVSPWTWLAVLALACYWLAATYHLLLPGVNYDEVADVVPAMEFLLRQPLDVAGIVHIAGRDWPLMIMPYISAASTYLALPVFYLAGVTVAALRYTMITVGLVSLILAWGFLREYLDERAAALAVLLLAVNPTYIFWTRMGVWVALPLLPVTLLTLWLLFRWRRRGGRAALVAAAFLLGFGLTVKLLFLWVWVALVLGWLILSPWLEPDAGGLRRWTSPGRRPGQERRLSPGLFGLCVLAVGVGLLPLLIYNLQVGGTLNFFREDVMARQGGAAGLWSLLRAMPLTALRDLTTLLDGSWFEARLGASVRNPLALPALVVAILILAGLALRKRLVYSRMRVAFLLIYLFSIVVMSSASSVSQGAEHLLILWPAPQALVAAAVFGLAATSRSLSGVWRRLAWVLLIGAVVGMVGAEAGTTWRYHQELARTGGVGHFSDAIYQLAADAETPEFRHLVVLDWGFTRNLQFLSQGRLRPETRFSYDTPPNPEFTAYLEQNIARPEALYLFHVPAFTAFPGHYEVLARVASWFGRVPVLVKTYQQRDGEPVYLLYRIEPAPPLYELPPTARPLQATLGDDLALAGMALPEDSLRPGAGLDLTLYWRSIQPAPSSYKVFVHLVDETGKLWAQHDGIPQRWQSPTDTWQPGQIIPDAIHLTLSPDMPAGSYHLFAGMYDPATGERLPLFVDGQRMQGDTLELATIAVGG